MLPTQPERSLPQRIVTGILAVVLLGTLLVVGELARTFFIAPPATSSPSIISAPPPPPYATVAPFPPELLTAAVAIATFYAPTPSPTPWPIRPTSTPTDPPLYCGMSSLPGQLCQWPQPTPLPPTPEPRCLTPAPGQTCRWLGVP